ncbi:hypothetical protein ACHAXT_004853 [Thalassiosira profunda]
MLHENLERKRRQNVAALNEAGACHLCESTSGSRSYHRFVSLDGDEGSDVDEDDGASDISCDAASDSDNAQMRTCMCFGNTKDWPYSLRVCEMCVTDDATTGRVRLCGICGVVACDENCGVPMVEVTDKDANSNSGCLECRGMESFSEIELFRRRPYPNGIPRATRVCTSCLELFSLFSYGAKYHFTCRYFKCNNVLVPSHVVELKRFLKPFPVGLLPEELMDSIVDYLGGKDLFSFGLVCTSMFKKVESKAMEIVQRHQHQLPSGPVRSIVRPTTNNPKRTVMYAEGKNNHPLQVPEDGKTWVGVLMQMEHLARSAYYFDFQIDGEDSKDDGAAMRYLRKQDTLTFDRVYSKPAGTAPIVPNPDTFGLMVRGGQVLVTRYKWHRLSFMEERGERNNVRSVIFGTDKALESGIHRVIVRYYCFCEGESLGSIGILRQQGDGSVEWAQQCVAIGGGRLEENIFGMEYDADRRTLTMYKKSDRTNKMISTAVDGQPFTIAEGGSLCFAAALSAGSVGIKGNQLGIRECSDAEWSAFLSHTVEKNLIPRIRGRARRGEERLMRYLDHRARRELQLDEDGQADMARVEVEHMMNILVEDELRAMEGPADNEDDNDDLSIDSDSDNESAPGLAPARNDRARREIDSDFEDEDDSDDDEQDEDIGPPPDLMPRPVAAFRAIMRYQERVGRRV